MSGVLGASMFTGSLPVIITVAGLAGIGVLLARRRGSWWRRVVPVVVAASAAAAMVIGWIVNSWWQPFPDPLPARILAWIGFALFGVGLAIANWGPRRAVSRSRRMLIVPVLAVLLALPAMKINAFYGYYPTLGDALGLSATNEIDFAAIAPPQSVAPVAPVAPVVPGRALVDRWQPPADMPPSGRVSRVTIPGTQSGFAARQASVYLPSAYLASHRPDLPVLVLVAGQPGAPQDWLTAGKLSEVMDRFAASHAGLAPIVVMPDATGSELGNPLCMDSALANVETYLARDVPAWVKANLQVDPDSRHWAIGGFSYGGTCALQLAVRAPGVYPTFLDISGQQEPTLGNHRQTVRATFGGDEAKFRAANPLDILTTTIFPDSAGMLVVGEHDRQYGPQANRVVDAAGRAHMSVQLAHVRGMHSWTVAVEAMKTALPWIAARLGLTSA